MGSACLKKATPARCTAIHEAGHAVAHWWNGQGIYSITARTRAETLAGPYIDRRGRESSAIAGMVEAASFISAPALALEYGHAMDNELLAELVARDLLHAYSGPVAEAIYRRAGLDGVLWAAGYGDVKQALGLLALLPEGQRGNAERRAIARCRELVRRYWPAIETLANLLQERGRIEGGDVEELLCAVTGESPTWRGNPLADLDKRGARHE
ncbi:hypothetical protein EQ828_09420 [Ectopseudomonas mendocina]|nr:hypothetical protein EQ828_09420 [Pseudomonas mendocina]